ncbi:hypothetical protein NKG94_30520 [Micromonospora sp. M12]
MRTSVDALCQQLRATADAVALTADPAVAAAQLVGRGLAAAVLITDVAGKVTYVSPGAPATPWRDCSGPTNNPTNNPTSNPTNGATSNGATSNPIDNQNDGPVGALAAQVDLRDRAGTRLGAVAAAQLVDPAFVARLAAVTGWGHPARQRASAARVAHTTESRRYATRWWLPPTPPRASRSARPVRAGTCGGSGPRPLSRCHWCCPCPASGRRGCTPRWSGWSCWRAARRADRVAAGPGDHPAVGGVGRRGRPGGSG